MVDKLNHKASRKGQSTVEYIVLVTAVLGVVILFMTNPNTGFQSHLNTTLGASTDLMGNMAARQLMATGNLTP